MAEKKAAKTKVPASGGAPKTKKKAETIISPQGVAAYAWVHKPDTKFDDEGKFKVDLVLDKKEIDDKAKAFLKMLSSKDKKLVKDGDKHKSGENGENPFAGKWHVTFKSSYAPDLRDAAKQKLPADVKVYSGDVIRVAFSMAEYEGFGGGYTLYLNAIQLIEKRNFGNAAGDAFDAVEGFPAESVKAAAAETDDVDF